MKKFSALVLAGFAVFALNGCTGASADGTTDDGYDDNGGGTTTGDYISLNNLSGYAIIDYGGSTIDFCDGVAYVYNSNAQHYGEYLITNSGYTVSFYPQDEGGSYRIDTDGFFREGSTYDVYGVNDSITIDSIELANCN